MLHDYINVRILHQLFFVTLTGMLQNVKYFCRIKWKRQRDAFLEILVFNLRLQFCISSNGVIIRDNPTKSIGCVLED